MIVPRVKRRVALSKLAANGQYIITNQPLVVLDGWSVPRGSTTSRSLCTGFIECDSAPLTPDTPQYHLWIDISAAELAYTARPTRVAKSIFGEALYHRFIEVQVSGIMGDTDCQIIENTLFARTVGVTQDRGHCILVYELSGQIEARSNAKRISWRQVPSD